MKLKDHQKTTIPAGKQLEGQWFITDVKGKTLGSVATKLADLIRGKGKPFFTPQHDCGDYVVVLNAAQIRLAGNKMDSKLYYRHSGYGGGLKVRTARQVMERKPEQVLFDAVWGMLPRNRLRKFLIKKLRIFPGETHEHASQSPKSITL